MTAKDITILISPIILLLTIAVLAVVAEQNIKRHYNVDLLRENAQKFDNFVESSQSGELQLSQEQMIEYMRRSRLLAESERTLALTTSELVASFAYLAGSGVLLQMAVVIWVRKRLTKRESRIG
jgi:hypothetical protein